MEAKIRKIGNSLGVLLPKQLIEELHLKDGDKLSIEKTGKGIELSAQDPEFEKWVEGFNQLNMDYKEVLKALAK